MKSESGSRCWPLRGGIRHDTVDTDGINVSRSSDREGTSGPNDECMYIYFMVPIPGALMLVGLAGLVRHRRWERSAQA